MRKLIILAYIATFSAPAIAQTYDSGDWRYWQTGDQRIALTGHPTSLSYICAKGGSQCHVMVHIDECRPSNFTINDEDVYYLRSQSDQSEAFISSAICLGSTSNPRLGYISQLARVTETIRNHNHFTVELPEEAGGPRVVRFSLRGSAYAMRWAEQVLNQGER